MKLLGSIRYQSFLVISFSHLDYLDDLERDALDELDTYTYAAYLLQHALGLEYVYFWLGDDEWPLACWKVVHSGEDGAERSLEEMTDEESLEVIENTVFAR